MKKPTNDDEKGLSGFLSKRLFGKKKMSKKAVPSKTDR